MQQQETELETYLLGEIINHKSNDYLQNYYFTHKCVDRFLIQFLVVA